jgi:hypothetical protein
MDNRDRDDKIDLGNPLGLGGTPVTPDAPDHLRAKDDEESIRRRRARAGIGPFGDDRTTDGLGDLNTDRDGATGIDMGYGGDGTDVKPGGTR